MTDDFAPPHNVPTGETLVDWMSRPEYRADRSPIYRAVWEINGKLELFASEPASLSNDTREMMVRAVECVRIHCQDKTLWNSEGIVCPGVLDELAGIGYWGLLVDRQYGGQEAPFHSFVSFLTRMASVDPTVAALASVHSCIGAVTALKRFGTPEQRRRFLPQLAQGKRLSVFALTEPAAGSDLSSLRTYADRCGDRLLVYGEKLFITNLSPGRVMLLICLVDGEPTALICELPEREDATFRLQHYGLYALQHAENCGVRFDGFSVPAENRLRPSKGNGLTVAYHGLNHARIALCATAAGTLRRILADLIPWVRYRTTYGRPIGNRQLVQIRLARLAGLIVSCDALTTWAAGLLESGYRCELEGITAKVFAADALRQAAIDVSMKTHGGRAFLQGHPFGDRLYDYLAPSIYEGESEMLRLAFFHSLLKEHAKSDVGNQESADRKATGLAQPWGDFADQARSQLRDSAREIRELQQRHGATIFDHQGQLADLSGRIQNCIVVLCTCQAAVASDDAILRLAAKVSVLDLLNDLRGIRPDENYYRDVNRLGAAVIEGRFSPLADVEPSPILLS